VNPWFPTRIMEGTVSNLFLPIKFMLMR